MLQERHGEFELHKKLKFIYPIQLFLKWISCRSNGLESAMPVAWCQARRVCASPESSPTYLSLSRREGLSIGLFQFAFSIQRRLSPISLSTGWNCYCGWSYALKHGLTGYENNRTHGAAKCMGSLVQVFRSMVKKERTVDGTGCVTYRSGIYLLHVGVQSH